MGNADDKLHVDVDDALELGSMPPLPRPQAHPAVRSPLSVISSRSSAATRKSTPRAAPIAHHRHDDDDVVQVSPPPVPHAHPLRGWKPQERQSAAAPPGRGVGAAMMEHMRRPPLRSRPVDVQRLDPTMLNRDRVNALANQENIVPNELIGLEMVPHSTRALETRIQQVASTRLERRPLTEEELRFAATDASQLRQLGYDAMDPLNRRRITAQPSQQHPEDSALERARLRKVKKQVDAQWLEKRNDPALRPLGPLEREDEKEFYDSVYTASMQDLLDAGVLYDEQDRKSARTVHRIEWNDLARDTRGTTGLCGSCFDEWSFQQQ
jgi:hypothetical protein